MYARLIDSNNAVIVPFNMGRGIVPNGATVSKHINILKERFNQYPDGIYFAEFKVSPGGNKFRYQINKGNNFAAATPMIINTPVPLEKFQTLDEWKRQEMEINRLKNELELLKMQNSLTLKENVKNEDTTLDKFKGFAESILPIFVPLAENYFKLKERELTLKENNFVNKKTQSIKKVLKKYRPLPDVNNINELNKYFNYFESLNDKQAEQELNEVELINIELFNLLNSKYYEEN